jgi:hypothetical protein
MINYTTVNKTKNLKQCSKPIENKSFFSGKACTDLFSRFNDGTTNEKVLERILIGDITDIEPSNKCLQQINNTAKNQASCLIATGKDREKINERWKKMKGPMVGEIDRFNKYHAIKWSLADFKKINRFVHPGAFKRRTRTMRNLLNNYKYKDDTLFHMRAEMPLKPDFKDVGNFYLKNKNLFIRIEQDIKVYLIENHGTFSNEELKQIKWSIPSFMEKAFTDGDFDKEAGFDNAIQEVIDYITNKKNVIQVLSGENHEDKKDEQFFEDVGRLYDFNYGGNDDGSEPFFVGFNSDSSKKKSVVSDIKSKKNRQTISDYGSYMDLLISDRETISDKSFLPRSKKNLARTLTDSSNSKRSGLSVLMNNLSGNVPGATDKMSKEMFDKNKAYNKRIKEQKKNKVESAKSSVKSKKSSVKSTKKSASKDDLGEWKFGDQLYEDSDAFKNNNWFEE